MNWFRIQCTGLHHDDVDSGLRRNDDIFGHTPPSYRRRPESALLLIVAGIIIFLSISPARAAFEEKISGARAAAMSGAVSADCADASAVFNNPAGLRGLTQAQAQSFYSQIYSLKDLTFLGAAVAIPGRWGAFGFGFTQFGPSSYREQEINLAHSVKFSERFYFGYRIKPMFLSIQNFGRANTIGLDAGFLSVLNQRLTLALAVKNLNQPKIGQSQERIANAFSLGASFQALDQLKLNADFERTSEPDFLFRSAAEYALTSFFALRCGFQTNPAQFSAGFGAQLQSISVDYAYQHHAELSGTHQFSFNYKFILNAPKVLIAENKPLRKKTNPPAARAVKEPQPLFLNSMEEKDLEQCGLSAEQIKNIRRYRKKNRGILTFSDLRKIPLINDAAITLIQDCLNQR